MTAPYLDTEDVDTRTSPDVAEKTPTPLKNALAARKRQPARKARNPTADDAPDGGLRNQKRMALRFAQIYRGRFIHTPGRGWLEFNGAYWEDCGETGPWNGVQAVCRAALDELSGIDRTDWRDQLYEDVRMCDSANGTSGVLKHAKHWPGIAVRDEDLDAHPELFVCRNGTIDLRTGEFRASDPDDLMTLAGGVDYDPSATCPQYDSLMELYQPDPAVRAYFHRLGGAALEGRQNLEYLVVNYGATGGNGKGTTQRAWMHVFGAYAHILPVEALIARRGYDQYRDEKAQLKGKRLVYLTEPSAGQRFDTGTVKSITGKDPITSRAVYKASVTFDPSWLIMMSTNNRVGTPADGGMARRLKEIGWGYTVPRDKMRDDLDIALAAEGSGILNRLLAGWTDYRDNGIQEPEVVKEATSDYLASVDPIQQFLDECVTRKEGFGAPSSSIYQAYADWCRDNGEHPVSSKVFSPDLERRGYIKSRQSGGIVWQSIALLSHDKEF